MPGFRGEGSHDISKCSKPQEFNTVSLGVWTSWFRFRFACKMKAMICLLSLGREGKNLFSTKDFKGYSCILTEEKR